MCKQLAGSHAVCLVIVLLVFLLPIDLLLFAYAVVQKTKFLD